MERTRATSTNTLALKMVQLKAVAVSAPKLSAQTSLKWLDESLEWRKDDSDDETMSVNPIRVKD